MPGLGRLPQFDENNLKYPMRAALEEVPATEELPDYKYYSHFSFLVDQGQTGTCVGHAWHHFEVYPPVNAIPTSSRAIHIYREACVRDVWPQNDDGRLDFGTSILAGAKALSDPNGPFAINGKPPIAQYLWAYDLETMVRFLLSGKGVVVIGVNWYGGMFDTDKNGMLHLTGGIAGGHAVVVDGVNRRKGVVRIGNSWGPWGGLEVKGIKQLNGRGYLTFENMERLIREDGEICTAVEQKIL